MPQRDWLWLMGIGVFFILLGFGAILWGRKEEKGYYDTLSHRRDTREYLERWPLRPQFGALAIGGGIAITIGVLMIVTGIVIQLKS